MNTGKGKIRDKKKSSSQEPIIAVDTSSLLTLDDIIRGGEAPKFVTSEIPSVIKGGQPGKVLHREASAGLVMYIQGVAEGKIQVSEYEALDVFTRTVADLLVKPDGSPMFTLEDAKKIPPSRIQEILFGIMFSTIPESLRAAVIEKVVEEGTSDDGESGDDEDPEGNVDGEAMASQRDGAASPTDSHDSSASAT